MLKFFRQYSSEYRRRMSLNLLLSIFLGILCLDPLEGSPCGGNSTSHPRCRRNARLTLCSQDLPTSCMIQPEDDNTAADIPESDISFVFMKVNGQLGPTPTEIKIDDLESLKQSGYDKSLDTKLIIHGYLSSAKQFEYMVAFYMTYMPTTNYNIILMDWAKLSKWCYCQDVLKKIRGLGQIVGKFLDFLAKSGTDVRRVHIIAHSLGSHIAGIGSVTASNRTRVGRISALDPARPGFTAIGNNERLNKSRADFVDVIHTDGHHFGISEPLGHIDFYPNGGEAPQPGCTGVLDSICSHSRAHYLFAQSIMTDVGFRSVLCEDWNAFQTGDCNAQNAPTANMGERLNRSSPHGSYFLKTGATCTFFDDSPGVTFNILLFLVAVALCYLVYITVILRQYLKKIRNYGRIGTST